MFTVRIKGPREMRDKIAQLRGASEAALDPAVQAGALVIENLAKGFAPKRTGTLARSITSERAD